jgi:hypothetical protein
MSFRFSLRQLLIVVALASVATAALAQPGYWWHATIATAVVAAAIGMLIAALVCDGVRRAFAIGWLVMAVGYLAVVFGPWTSTQLAPQLLTTKAISRLEAKWLGDQPSPAVFGQAVYDYDGDGSVDLWVPASGYVATQPSGGSGRALWSYSGSQFLYQPAAPPGNWLVTANYTVFQGTAHWLLSAALGYCGGVFGGVLSRRRRSLK